MPLKSDYSVRGILDSSHTLAALTNEEKVALAEECRLSQCHKGSAIWQKGYQVSFFGLVGAGFVKMAKANSSGSEVTLEIMGPGQIFGLLGTIDGEGCPLTAYGMTNTIYVKIRKAAFLSIYEKNHALKDRLLRKTAIRVHQTLDLMAKLSTGRASERIAVILFILAESYGRHDGKAIRIELPLTRQQIGEMAGTTTETTIRTLSKWAQQDLVDTEDHIITLLDPARLERAIR